MAKACCDCGCAVEGMSWRCPPCKKARARANISAYRAAHPDVVLETARRNYHKDRGATLAKRAAYRAENRAKINEQAAKYRATRKEELAERQRQRRAEKPEETKRLNAQRYSRNPEANKSGNFRRRCRRDSGKLSKGLTAKLFEQQKGLCACCGAPLGQGYHLDHIMPLALGGTNTDDNMQLLTARCNLQKNAMHPDDFMRTRRALHGQSR